MSEKKDKLKEIAPHIWSMYQHVFEGRIKLENALNYFLAINTLFLVLAIQVLQHHLAEWSLLYIIPVILLFLPMLLLIANFFSKPLRVPWLEKETLSTSLQNMEFYELWISSIFSSAYGSFEYQKRIGRLLRICISLVAAALVWLLIVFILALCDAPLSTAERLAVLVVMALGIVLIVSRLIQNQVEFPHQQRTEEVRRFLAEWLSIDSNNTGNESTHI